MSTPSHVVVREFIFSIACIVVVILPYDPGWYPSSVLNLQTKSYKPMLGLFASSTPFVTGQPYTLIFNGSVKSSTAAVSLALSSGSRSVAETTFPGLRAITAPLKVPGSEGNLINELDNANHTALSILESYRSSGEMATGKTEIRVTPICSCSRLDLLRKYREAASHRLIAAQRERIRQADEGE